MHIIMCINGKHCVAKSNKQVSDTDKVTVTFSPEPVFRKNWKWEQIWGAKLQVKQIVIYTVNSVIVNDVVWMKMAFTDTV